MAAVKAYQGLSLGSCRQLHGRQPQLRLRGAGAGLHATYEKAHLDAQILIRQPSLPCLLKILGHSSPVRQTCNPLAPGVERH